MTEHDPGPFAPLSLAELFALGLPEVEWAVDGILPLGAAALLSAREKAGKGLLAIDLCACVALGEPFLDRAVREGPAVYAAAEEHVRDVRARIAARVGGRRDAPLYVLPLDGSTGDRLKLDDAAAMQRLWDMVAALEPVVVVLDTLREFHDRKEDSSDEMGPLLRPVRQLAHQTNTTVVVNHHQNKLGGFRGSTAIRAAFDLEWAFARSEEADGDEGPPRGALRVEGRHGPRKTLQVRLGAGMRWEPAAALAVPPEPAIRERILAHLAAVDGWRTALEIAAGLGVADKTAQNALAAIVREEPRPVAVEGTGAKNAPRRYRALAPKLPGLGRDGAPGPVVPPDAGPQGGEAGGNDTVGADAGGLAPPRGATRGGRNGGDHTGGGRGWEAESGPAGEPGADGWTR